MKKILFVVTSDARLGDTGKPTGYYLSEVTHPWEILGQDFTINVVSPKGGEAPAEGVDLTDPINKKFWEDASWRKVMANTLKPAEVKPQEYAAIFYAGGHGVMWDLPEDKAIAAICSQIWRQGGVVAAVCHGPAGLLNVFLEDGIRLIDGRKLTSFSNAEEELVGMTKVVPFLLETALERNGAIYSCEKPWSDYVVVDGNLVTGQNPQSALSVGKAIHKLLG